MTSTSIDYQQASQMKDCVKHAQSDRLHGLFGRLLTVSVAVPVSLFLLSSYQLRIVFGLCLSTLGGLELQTSFNRHLQIKLSLCQRLLCTVPSSALLISTAMFGRTGLSHSLFLIPIAISCYFVLYNMGHGPLQSNLYNRYVFALFQCFYIGGTLAHASLLNDLPYALEALLYTILVTCVGEAFGFFGGVVFGQHHITRISPGKTLEGYLSTLLAGVATSFCFDWVLNWFYPESRFPLQHLHLHGLSILISLMASIGDLLESLVKRGFSIKDMGDVLPGMGGLLDRLVGCTAVRFPYYILLSSCLSSPSSYMLIDTHLLKKKSDHSLAVKLNHESVLFR